MTNTEFTSQPYRLTPATYFRIVAGAKLPTLIATAMLTLFAATVAAVIIDLRILLVALIIIFLILPFGAAHIYYNTLLTADARYALAKKQVTLHADGSITETFLPADDDDETPVMAPRTHSSDSIIAYRQTSAHAVYIISPAYHLIVPRK